MISTAKAIRIATDCFDGINERDMNKAVGSFTDDAIFEFIGDGPPDKLLNGREAVRANFAGWWEASPEIIIDVVGVTVDKPLPRQQKEVALEWDQRATDGEGTRWRRRGVTVFAVTSDGIVGVRDYLSELYDPQPAS